MRRIADKVGVTPTAIYRHFTNKDELVSAIVSEGFTILTNYVRQGRKGRSRTTLVLMFERYFDFAIDYPQYYDLMFLVSRSDARRFPDDFHSRESAAFNVVFDVVSELIESGKLKQDDGLEVTLTLWSLAHGLVSLHRCGRFGSNPEKVRKILNRSLNRLIDGLV